MMHPKIVRGGGSANSTAGATSVVAAFSAGPSSSSRTGKTGASRRAMRMPQVIAMAVAMSAGITIAVGFFAPLIASRLIAVVGTSWMLAVLIARKVTIALLAVPGRGLSCWSSAIARRPSGVAALL